jgi:hypothetical protein
MPKVEPNTEGIFGPDIDPPELASTSPSGEIAGSTPPFQG